MAATPRSTGSVSTRTSRSTWGRWRPSATLAADTLSFGSFASLTVNLTDPSAEWTIGPNAVVTVNAIGGMLGGGGIQGSDVNVEGTVNISGNSIWVRAWTSRARRTSRSTAVGICAAAPSLI